MLRILTTVIICFGLTIAGAVVAEKLSPPSEEQKEKYRELVNESFEKARDPAMVEEQKQAAEKALKDAEALRKSKKHQEMVAEEMKKAQRILNNRDLKGDYRVNVPEFSRAEAGQAMQEAFQQTQDFRWPEQKRSKPIVLVSLSMPEVELERLMLDAGKVGGTLVIRGIIDDDITKTADHIRTFMLGVIERNKGKAVAGIDIDPTIFHRFGVFELVPVFIMPLDNIEQCTTMECPVPRYVKASGSVTFRYFLEAVERLSNDEEEIQVARTWLSHLDGGS